jgi:hypothetical protein
MRILLAILALASFTSVQAQINVEVVFDQETYLANEPLLAKVRISNASGQTIPMGKGSDWLTFNFEGRDNLIVTQKGPVPVEGEFKSESSTTVIKTVNLEPYFNLSQPGRYSVSATVNIPGWGQSFSSRPKNFNITRGARLWETNFGVPSAKTNTVPEIRKYVLQQGNHIHDIRLYLRLMDAGGGITYKVLTLGQMLSFSHPEPQLDKESNLHVLFQISARGFSYLVITPDGEFKIRRIYDYTDSRPVLRADENGNIAVTGGIRRITASDLPRPPQFDDFPSNEKSATR